MKKVLLIVIVLLLSALILCGCSQVNSDGRDILHGRFVVLEDRDGLALVYEMKTGIMYYINHNIYRSSMAECWIFDDNAGEAHVGHYPEDW